MKRTLTAAAALVASSAGAVGFAGTATAAETTGLPADLPVDNGVGNTAVHLAGATQSATKTVGDVVPSDAVSAQPMGRTGISPLGDAGPVGGVLGGGDPVGGVLGGGNPVSGLTGGGDPVGGLAGGPVGGVVGGGGPVGGVLGGGSPVSGLTGGGDPVGGLTGGGDLGKNVTGLLPAQTLPADTAGVGQPSGRSAGLPAINTPRTTENEGNHLGTTGQALKPVANTLSGKLPLGESGGPLPGPVGDVVGDSPLGTAHTLGM